MARSKTLVQAELDAWYAARLAAAAGKSFTIVTSAGTRVLTTQDLEDINNTIALLERELAAPTTSTNGGHNFSLANFNNGAQR